ncbi:Phosphate regulon transcriptional regulatory protein PhoB (SphR) [Minicystis rosea]|nr:Phosphate regulon transcriptional regulatory protein PhoB (SphR) [Minicystis rosea]
MSASPQRSRILLVEDDTSVARGVVEYLEPRGFEVEHVTTLAAARRALGVTAFAVILLDWMLPDGEGMDLVREIAARAAHSPIVFLTARTELADRVVGLESGAADYITKPFEPRELLARLHVQLRLRRADLGTGGAQRPARVPRVAGPFAIDLSGRAASYRGVPLVLTKLEFDLLSLFVREEGRVFSREELLNQVWGYDAYPTTRTVDTHVFSLRQKSAAEHFATVRGVGYRFVADVGGELKKS